MIDDTLDPDQWVWDLGASQRSAKLAASMTGSDDVAAHPLFDSANDLAARLREWLDAHPHAPESLEDLLTRAAAALDQAGRGDLDDEARSARQLSYKEVLATRGERNRPDGTPIWPLRPDDFPSSFKNPPEPRAQVRLPGDLPDWMR